MRTNEYKELTAEKFAEIYTDEGFRNSVAFAHKCCDRWSKFLHYGTCSYPQRYIVTEQQITEAKQELERAKAEVYEKHSNDLLFACMGGDYAQRYEDDVCNYRIRTEFLNRHGKRFFIEFSRLAKGNGFTITHAIDRDREIELNRDPNRQHEYYNYKELGHKSFDLDFTKTNIRQIVNRYFDCCFKEIVIDQHTIHPDDREITCESPK